MSGLCSAGLIQGCDGGELQKPAVCRLRTASLRNVLPTLITILWGVSPAFLYTMSVFQIPTFREKNEVFIGIDKKIFVICL